ncbi:MAG TPA: NAD(P)-dependent oxidoreductase [Solirubrobacteraceae bacterium]|jgi:nucleoside-diphosphate-sugar epimerase
MRVFVAGATGVIGRRLVPMLLAAGHQVTGMTRSSQRAQALRDQGAESVIADALDQAAVRDAVLAAEPEAVIHQLTSIPQRVNPRKIGRDFLLNDRLRSEGTRILVGAAREAGAQRIIAQSVAFIYAPGPAGTLHTEADRLLLDDAPSSFRRTARALNDLESTVLDADGTVLRYGYFYGPGTWLSPQGSVLADVRRRRLPIVGDGGGTWSFIHIDDAARATTQALGHDGPGVYNIVDDDPALVRDWIPFLAEVVGAAKPRRVPMFLARLAGGEYAVTTMTRAQGASNTLAREKLGWQPQHSSWREGFRAALG